MKTVPLMTVVVNRDAMTRIPTTIPAHEVQMALVIFGEDNVQITDEAAGTVELDPAAEGERLASKYGEAQVIRVFGEAFKAAVAKACNDASEVTTKARGRTPVAA